MQEDLEPPILLPVPVQIVLWLLKDRHKDGCCLSVLQLEQEADVLIHCDSC